MSIVQTSKFGRAVRLAKHSSFQENVYPDLGLHTGVAPNKMSPGFSPSLQNLLNKEDGRVSLREGLAVFGSYDFIGPVLGAEEVQDNFGNLVGFAPSINTVSGAAVFSYIHPKATSPLWSALSFIPGSIVSSLGVPSSLSNDYWHSETIYEPSADSMMVVTSNNTGWAQFFYVHSATTLYSDFTWIDSLVSTKAAQDIVAINDRLVFFNTVDVAEKRYPTRVLWSSRGLPLDYSIANGAGFEDLKDMRGYGQAAVHHKDFVLLFSDQEIWRALPTRDAYAFQFDLVVDNLGCTFPNTILDCPNGVVFVGKDYEVYITDGNGYIALGPVNGQGSSRIQKMLREDIVEPTRMWGLYNQTQNRYELYYSTATSTDGFPDHALYYMFEDQTWWKQKFNKSLSSGMDLEDPNDLTTWQDISTSWQNTAPAWDDYNTTLGSRSINVFDSNGSTFRFRSTSTTDDGTAIDVRWRSPALNAENGDLRASLHELWLDYEAAAPSTVSFYLSEDMGATFDSGTAVSITTTNRHVFVPVWTQSRHPQFELRSNDGIVPDFFRVNAQLRRAGKF